MSLNFKCDCCGKEYTFSENREKDDIKKYAIAEKGTIFSKEKDLCNGCQRNLDILIDNLMIGKGILGNDQTKLVNYEYLKKSVDKLLKKFGRYSGYLTREIEIENLEVDFEKKVNLISSLKATVWFLIAILCGIISIAVIGLCF